MLTQVMFNLLPGFRVVLDPFATTLKQIVLNKNLTSLVKKSTPYKDKGTRQKNSYSEIPRYVSESH